MIVQLFLHAMCALFSWMLDLLPSWSAPSFLDDLNSALASIASATDSTSVWFPWQAIAIALAVLVAAATAALVVKSVRLGLSLFTGGGGSAA